MFYDVCKYWIPEPSAASYCSVVVGYSPEKTAQTWASANRKSPLADGYCVALRLSQDELINTKAMSWVDILQGTKAVSRKQSYRSQKARLGHLFRGFPRTMGEAFVFILAGGAVYMLFDGLNGRHFNHGVRRVKSGALLQVYVWKLYTSALNRS